MIISCPECSTQYNIPEDKISPNGRTLKCKKCEHKWHFMIKSENKTDEVKIKVAPIISNPAFKKTPLLKKVINKKSRNWTLIFAIPLVLASLIILGMISYAPIIVSKIFPKTIAYYQSIDKIKSEEFPKKLAFNDTKLEFNDSYKFFELHTVLKNLTESIVKLPMRLQITGIDKDNHPVQDWQVELSSSFIEPAAELSLKYELNNMKPDVDQIELKLQQL